MAMDSTGDVVVTGYSHDTANLYASTVAYAADGTLLWEYGQPGVNDDVTLGSAVTIDAQGSVMVAGSALQDQVGSYLVLRLPSQAQLLVSQPVTTPLPSNAVISFGTDNGASLPTKTFVITNTGGTNLNLGAITKDGQGSSSYTFTAPTNSMLLPGSSTSFAVTFASSINGSHQATLHIPSDDPNAPVFNVTLSGTGSAAATATASQVSAGWATLNGNGNANGAATFAYFQYGVTTNYGATTGGLNLGSSTTTTPLSFNIAGLAKGATYHYRLVTNSGGTLTYGADQTFTTSSSSPASWHSAQISSLTNPSLNNMADGARTGAAHSSWNLYFYKGTDNNIWSVFPANGQWAQQQLTTGANASDWLAFEPTYSILCYQGTDGNLWCVYYNAATAQWVTLQLGSPPQGVTVAGDIVVDTYGGWNNVYYRGSDSHLYAAYFNGSAWVHFSLGGTATVKGNLAVEGNNHLVYYQGSDDNIWCFYYTGKVWEQLQLSTTGNVSGSVAVDHAGLVAYYKSSTDNSAWCTFSTGGPWTPVQLDASANMSASVTSFSNIAPYAANDCTLYLDNNGQGNSLYWNGSKWVHVLLGDGGWNLTGGLSMQPVNLWAFARRSDGNIIVFYNQ